MRGSGEGASERGGEPVGEMGRAFLERKGPQRQDGKDTESLEPPVCVPKPLELCAAHRRAGRTVGYGHRLNL